MEIRPQVVRADVLQLGIFHDEELVQRGDEALGAAGRDADQQALFGRDDFDLTLNFPLFIKREAECRAAGLDLEHVTGDQTVEPGLGFAPRYRQRAATGLQHDEHRIGRAFGGH